MEAAIGVMKEFDVLFEVRVLSAHRTPEATGKYAETAYERGIRVIIAGAGGAAHLAGVIAASTPIPIIGIPVPTRNLKGMDSLLSIVQMPGGVPVATVGIGNAKNAGLLAVQMLSIRDEGLLHRMIQYKQDFVEKVEGMNQRVQDALN